MKKIVLSLFSLIVFLINPLFGQNPGGISGASVWLKADAGPNTTTNAAAVNAWNDQSGNTRNFTQGAAANQPLYLTNWKNFNPAVDFAPGTSFDYLSYSSTTDTPFGTTGDYSIYTVYALDALTSNQIQGTFQSNGTNTTWRQHAMFQGSGFNGGVPAYNHQTGGSTNNPVSNHPYTGITVPQIAGLAFENNGLTPPQTTGGSTNHRTDGTNGTTTGEPVFGNNDFGYQLGALRSSFGMDGKQAEVIIFNNKTLTATEMDRLDSYLATKYGITLSHNYTSTNGATTYNISTYGNDIAGIAKDDATMLNQKQSKSINADALVTMGAGNMIAATNALNTATIADQNFLLWGNNNAAVTWTTTETYSPYREKLTREWKVDETGDLGTVLLRVPDDSSPLTSKLPAEGTSPVYLLYDADGDFSIGAIEVPMTLNGTNWEVSYDFPADGYFTFAKTFTPAPTPAGVTGPSFWIKADDGTSTTLDASPVTSWNTQGGSITTLSQSTASLQPKYDQVWHNFNPGVSFTNDYLFSTGTSPWTSTADGYSNFIAYEPITASANVNLMGNHTASPSPNGAVVYTTWTNAALMTMTHAAASTNTAVSHPHAASTVYVQESSYTGTNPGTGTSNGTASTGGNGTAVTAASGFGIGGSRNALFTSPNTTVGEVIIYPTPVSAMDKLKVDTYLALKYGVTLSSNYVAPDGSILWDIASNSPYNNDIAGIGNDGYCLMQKQSKSVNSDDIVTISKGNLATTNPANTASLKEDNFKLWGNDNGSTATFSEIPATGGVDKMARQWRFHETGSVGKVKLYIPAASLPVPSGENPYLIVSSDASFTAADQFLEMTLVGSNYEIEVDCKDGDYFSFGYGNDISVNLSVSKSALPTTASSGEVVSVTTTITNAGPTSATGVKVKDLVPLGMTLNSAVPSIGTYNPSTGLWFIPSLAPGTATLTMTFTVQ